MTKELIINTYLEDILLFKENLLGKLENNILKYENETDSFLIDIDKKRFSKENLESILEITESNSYITLKEIDKTFEIDLKKCNFLKVKDKIVIEYLLESQEKPIKIEIEMSDNNA